MISYNKALRLMEQNIKVSKKSEKVNIFNSYKRVITNNISSKKEKSKM